MNATILGGGMTGLAAGWNRRGTIYEAASGPGGICCSYALKPGSLQRMNQRVDEDTYRFELGGGHWIFGDDPKTLAFISDRSALQRYQRISSVFFWDRDLFVPYPIQNNLRFLDRPTAERALQEITNLSRKSQNPTLAEWLHHSFGRTLTDLFFRPFHELYTAGLLNEIAPQDEYKSPVNLSAVIQGASQESAPAGYNAVFAYPERGLDHLAGRIAENTQIFYEKRAVRIDGSAREIYFEDGTSAPYERLISTLPLRQMVEMTGVKTAGKPDPYTSVLVLNIGAQKGRRCPCDHWLYTVGTRSGFHRVGFYSNVDSSFLPQSSRRQKDRVCIYIERSYAEGAKPRPAEEASYLKDAVAELQSWEFIGEVDVVDATWIEVAYTWSYPGSSWKQEAFEALSNCGIQQAGRYGRWNFQGITESIREGLEISRVIP
jgi:protoporphyrinogen oxidase